MFPYLGQKRLFLIWRPAFLPVIYKTVLNHGLSLMRNGVRQYARSCMQYQSQNFVPCYLKNSYFPAESEFLVKFSLNHETWRVKLKKKWFLCRASMYNTCSFLRNAFNFTGTWKNCRSLVVFGVSDDHN